MAPTPRPGILDIAAYKGGEAQLGGWKPEEIARLASNENPLGPSPKAIAAYEALAGDLHRYPEGGSVDLRRAIAEVHGLDPERIVCGAGSDELITLLTRAYAGPGDEVLYSAHGFLMYPIAAKSAGASPVTAPERNLTADVDALLERVGEKTRVVFLANPNNPTGTYLPAAELRRLHAGLPRDVLLVIDAAYAEYADAGDYSDGSELVAEAENVVMTRTFSKVHGLASLRLGWCYGPEGIIDVLNRVRGPFNVSLPAQAAGVEAIRDREHLARSLAHNATWREWFRQQAAQAGIEALPSLANFVLLRFGAPAAADRALAHLKERGVLVRAMGGYGLPDCLRVTIGTEAEMRRTAEALLEMAERAA